jgi:hypothetical protein
MRWSGTLNLPWRVSRNSYNAVIRKQFREHAMQQPSWFRAALLFGLLIAVIILVFGMIGHAHG